MYILLASICSIHDPDQSTPLQRTAWNPKTTEEMVQSILREYLPPEKFNTPPKMPPPFSLEDQISFKVEDQIIAPRLAGEESAAESAVLFSTEHMGHDPNPKEVRLEPHLKYVEVRTETPGGPSKV